MRRGRRRRSGGYGGRAMRRVWRPPPRRSSRGHYSPAAARRPRAICVVVSDTLCCAGARAVCAALGTAFRRRDGVGVRHGGACGPTSSKRHLSDFPAAGRRSRQTMQALLPAVASNNAVSSLDSCLGLGDAAVVKTDGPQVLSTNAVAVLRAMIGGALALGLIDAALATAAPVLFPGAFLSLIHI